MFSICGGSKDICAPKMKADSNGRRPLVSRVIFRGIYRSPSLPVSFHRLRPLYRVKHTWCRGGVWHPRGVAFTALWHYVQCTGFVPVRQNRISQSAQGYAPSRYFHTLPTCAGPPSVTINRFYLPPDDDCTPEWKGVHLLQRAYAPPSNGGQLTHRLPDDGHLS